MVFKVPSFVGVPTSKPTPTSAPVQRAAHNPLLDMIRSQQAAQAAEGAASHAEVDKSEAAVEVTPVASDPSLHQRILWYHPESDSYYETIGLYSDDEVAGMDNVTDEQSHEAAFDYQQRMNSYEAEYIAPDEPLPDSAFEGGDDEATSIANVVGLDTSVDADHLRRAAINAARLYNIMEGVNITPDPSQVHAVHTLVHEQYGCLIGAAGTGKTTTTRMLLHVLMNGDAEAGIDPVRISTVNMAEYRKASDVDKADPEYDDESAREADMARAAETRIPAVALCAFTGQATQVLRKNLPVAWRTNAMTIHSLLAFAPAEYTKADGTQSMRFEPSYTREFRMPWDIIVVDEASMVNLELWHMLLDAAKPGCRFYFIGDLNQLPPPVGMGILGFALAKWTVCELTVVHRQSDEAANKIIDTAHAILNGRQEMIRFDDPKLNPNWRVIGFELKHQAQEAQAQVVAIAANMRGKKVDASVDPAQPDIYDPWRDRIMVPGNGFNPDEPGSALGQYPLNEVLSQIFTDKSVPRIIIDCQRTTKKFAVGYRVMATKNEPPDALNRVTNGLTGRITNIYPNPKWLGDRRLVGNETDVAMNRDLMLNAAIARQKMGESAYAEEVLDQEETDQDFDHLIESIASHNGKEEKISGPASHVVCVQFDNGAYRELALNAEVEQLMIAYASTVHKAQGAEMPTAIIVIHHANKFHLNREGLYTAVTRAKERVIILYTQFGLRIALSKQRVSGRDLKEKIANYLTLMGGEDGNKFKTVKVRLTEND